jgi:hypothetical protein
MVPESFKATHHKDLSDKCLRKGERKRCEILEIITGNY